MACAKALLARKWRPRERLYEAETYRGVSSPYNIILMKYEKKITYLSSSHKAAPPSWKYIYHIFHRGSSAYIYESGGGGGWRLASYGNVWALSLYINENGSLYPLSAILSLSMAAWERRNISGHAAAAAASYVPMAAACSIYILSLIKISQPSYLSSGVINI